MRIKLVIVILACFTFVTCKSRSSSSHLNFVQACGGLCDTYRRLPPDQKSKSLMLQLQGTFGPEIAYYYATVVALERGITISEAFTALGGNSDAVIANLQKGITANGRSTSLVSIGEFFQSTIQESMSSNPEAVDAQITENLIPTVEVFAIMLNTSEHKADGWERAALEYERFIDAAIKAFSSQDRATQQKLPSMLVLMQQQMLLKASVAPNRSTLARELNSISTTMWNVAGSVLNTLTESRANEVRGDILRLAATGVVSADYNNKSAIANIFDSGISRLTQGDVAVSSSAKATAAANFGDFATDIQCLTSVSKFQQLVATYGARANISTLTSYANTLRTVTLAENNLSTIRQAFTGFSTAAIAAARNSTLKYSVRAHTLPQVEAKMRMIR